jgi:RNA polymerase sigma-70 factor, ECF subfamily
MNTAISAPARGVTRDSTAAPRATALLQLFGPELQGFLVAILKDEEAAADVYGQFCEDFWRGLAGFRGECSERAWMYTLARHAAYRWLRSPARVRLVPLSCHPAPAEVPAPERTETAPHLKSAARDVVSAFRARLSPDEQALLTLRVDRGLEWLEIARVLSDEGTDTSASALTRKSAALRKRFERLKQQLRVAAGLGNAPR